MGLRLPKALLTAPQGLVRVRRAAIVGPTTGFQAQKLRAQAGLLVVPVRLASSKLGLLIAAKVGRASLEGILSILIAARVPPLPISAI